MGNNNGRKWTIAAFLLVCVAIAGLTVAFANLSQNLSIEPAAEVKKGNWEVKFDNFRRTGLTGKASGTETATISEGSTKITGISIELSEPGDSVTYEFDVVNNGTIDAVIDDMLIGEPRCVGNGEFAAADAALVCDHLTYTLVYNDGGPRNGQSPEMGDTLKDASETPANKRSLKLTITYDGGEDVPKDDVQVEDLAIRFTYVQD